MESDKVKISMYWKWQAVSVTMVFIPPLPSQPQV